MATTAKVSISCCLYNGNAKRILFLGGDQGKGRWKLMVAAFEIANRLIRAPKSRMERGR